MKMEEKPPDEDELRKCLNLLVECAMLNEMKLRTFIEASLSAILTLSVTYKIKKEDFIEMVELLKKGFLDNCGE